MARTPDIDPSIWQAALVGLEAQRAKIDEQIAVVRAQLGKGKPGRKPAPVVETEAAPARTRKPLSAAARKRIAAAQKKRWAAYKKQKAE